MPGSQPRAIQLARKGWGEGGVGREVSKDVEAVASAVIAFQALHPAHLVNRTYSVRRWLSSQAQVWGVGLTRWALSHCTRVAHSDPEIVIVGFSWDGSDERKMMSSFAFGRRSFGRFVDLAVVAKGLGYQQHGLATLTHRILGATLPKSKTVRACALHVCDLHSEPSSPAHPAQRQKSALGRCRSLYEAL